MKPRAIIEDILLEAGFKVWGQTPNQTTLYCLPNEYKKSDPKVLCLPDTCNPAKVINDLKNLEAADADETVRQSAIAQLQELDSEP